MGGPRGEEGSAENHPDIWFYPTLPTRPEGPNSWHQPPYGLIEEEGPLLLSLPLSSLGTTPMKRRHPCLPPAPGESRGAETGRLARGPQASPAPSTFLAFLTLSWKQGDPTLPAGSWALPAACVQLGFLPVYMRESACGGVTTGGGPGCQGGQERCGVSPLQGLGVGLNQSPSTACRSPEHS